MMSYSLQMKLHTASHVERDGKRWVNYEAAVMIKSAAQEAFFRGTALVKVVSGALRRANFLVV